MILCVTVLVIIALVGIAFLQRVRLDQAATARHERKYIDLVINGILSEISEQMTQDIFENANSGKELYDYPWTKDVKQVEATRIDNSTVLVNGAGAGNKPTYEDDRWLASSAPILSPANTYNWLHLTNLTGIWLDLEANNGEFPIDGPVGNRFRSDTDIRLSYLGDTTGRTEPLGVDADGDGVYDSRWQWTPVAVRDFGGRKFMMAVRIIDLNSMLNVNTATSLTAIGNLNDPEIFGGYSPAWADLSRLLSRSVNTTNNPISWRGELATMLNFRINQVPVNPFPDAMDILLTASELQAIWDDQASIYGNLDRNYLSDSEVELRRFGGINDLSIESPLERRMPRLLRQNPAPTQPESSFLDVVGNLAGVGGSFNNAAVGHWFYGHQTGDAQPVVSRRFAGLRHWLTTASGAGAYVTKYGGPSFPGGIRKYDLRHELNGALIDAQKLRERIDQAFKLPVPDTTSWYLGNTISSPETIDDVIAEYAMCIEDYADADSIPGGFNGGELNGGGISYGLERLPFLREVYLHALYEDFDADGDTQFDSWQAKNGTQAVAVELGNPFAHRLDMAKADGITNNVKIVIIQNGAEVSSWIFDNALAAAIPSIAARNGSDDSDLLLLISDTSDATPNGQGTGLDLEADLNLSTATNLYNLADGQLTFTADGSNIIIELQVDVSGDGSGRWVTYDRMETGLSFLSVEPYSNAASVHPAPPAPPQHKQASFWRDKTNINYVSADTGDDNRINSPDVTVAGGDFKSDEDQFLTDASGVGGTWTPPVGFQLPLADRPFRSVAELAWVHMFGFTDTEPFSERVGRLPGSRHFLLLDPADPAFRVLPPPPNGAGLPHAAVLMDLFTVNGTHEDGLDNDNDDGDDDPDTATTAPPGKTEASIDNDTEQFIPGLININTAPLHILTLGSPLAEGIGNAEALMRLIISYRDRPVLSLAGYGDDPQTPYPDSNLRTILNSPQAKVDRQNKPGIASIGELMFMDFAGANQPYNIGWYAEDGDAALPNELDLYPDPDETGAGLVDEGDDSNEQRLARFQFLSQAFTTRSDRFAVYCVIRGYDGWVPGSGRPIASGNLAETAQFIAIFDRSAMEKNTDTPRVIGFVRLQ